MSQAITASRLSDGVVVFVAENGGWTERLDQARLFEGKDATTLALDTAKRDEVHNLVVDVYAIDVSVKGGSPLPTKLREAIRARGPTVHPDFAKAGSIPATVSEDDHVSV